MSEVETWGRAEQLLSQRQIEAAKRQYARLRDSAELAIAARMRLSLIAGAQGDFRGAVDEVVDAVSTIRQPADPHALSMLFKRLMAVGEHELGLAVARDRALQQCHDIEPLAEVGKLLSDHGFPGDALHLLERAHAKGLASAPLHFLIGTCRMRLGDSERAEQNLERGIAVDAGFAPNHWQLAKLRRQSSESNHVDRLRQTLGGASQPMDRALLGYALFKELDDLGDHAHAWEAWTTAAATMKAAIGYRSQRDLDLLQRLLDIDADNGLLPARHEEDGGLAPLFIVGLPRSGTTLLERMLGQHRQVAAGGELGDLVMQLRYVVNRPGVANLDPELVGDLATVSHVDWGRRYTEHVAWRGSGKRFITDKLPTHFRLVGAILRAMPQARIIHVAREPVAACFSNLRECFFGGAYGYSNDLADMADYYLAYDHMMSQWSMRYPERIHRVSYEEMVGNTRATVAATLRHCGLDWDEACLDTTASGDVVATASAAQVREPIHTRSVAHWRHYESALAPLIERLGNKAGASA
ncbi:MAG: sulfotransferase [Lysobacteraceae bacterium]